VPEGKLVAKVVDGKFTFDVTPGQADVGYLVRIKAGKAKTELQLDGTYPYEYYYGYGEGDRVDSHAAAREADAARTAAREGDRSRQAGRREGDDAVQGPRVVDGRTDHVLSSEWKDVTGWRVDVELHARRVRAERLYQRVRGEGSAPRVQGCVPAGRAFGVASARVLPIEFTQNVKIIAPKEVRSSSPLVIALDAGAVQGATFATVASSTRAYCR